MCLPVINDGKENVDFLFFLLLRFVVELIVMDHAVCVVFHVIVSVMAV